MNLYWNWKSGLHFIKFQIYSICDSCLLSHLQSLLTQKQKDNVCVTEVRKISSAMIHEIKLSFSVVPAKNCRLENIKIVHIFYSILLLLALDLDILSFFSTPCNEILLVRKQNFHLKPRRGALLSALIWYINIWMTNSM